jgi:hypothetical protein
MQELGERNVTRASALFGHIRSRAIAVPTEQPVQWFAKKAEFLEGLAVAKAPDKQFSDIAFVDLQWDMFQPR